MGERIWNLTRLFSLRASTTQAVEDLPRRFTTEPLPGGPAAGHLFTDTSTQRLLAGYCAARGWDENGASRAETLAALSVECPRL
jgi:aldehyde:ferredoxin oxidoreductase